ncbi:hypothetical protein [Streptomyces actuosus]|uniref:hypothetical protein n=1 Tax=Streptomyces actuosus TaxID=1885 RepID=UPI001F050A43|nr:hypothetical protein [Streptomyces actuosus]
MQCGCITASRSLSERSKSCGYDSAGRLDWTWDDLTGYGIWHDFDAAGRPRLEQYVTEPDGVKGKRTYSYDSLGRLTGDKVTSPDGTTTVASTTYGYDLDDNLTSKKTGVRREPVTTPAATTRRPA